MAQATQTRRTQRAARESFRTAVEVAVDSDVDVDVDAGAELIETAVSRDSPGKKRRLAPAKTEICQAEVVWELLRLIWLHTPQHFTFLCIPCKGFCRERGLH